MKKEDAKILIHKEWNKWSENQDIFNPNIGFAFYMHLKNDCDRLLKFDCKCDQYQLINGWVESWLPRR